MTSPIDYRQKRALIIGINRYLRDPLQYCINDATDLRKILESINFCVSFGIDFSLEKLYHLIDSFVTTIQPNDLVLFYFAGHGKQNNDANYLLPSDYSFDHRENERDYIVRHAVNVRYIMEKINKMKCRITIYLLDCCRNKIRTGATNANQGLLPISALSQTLIVFACAPGSAVQDETRNNRNGSFIESLLKHITTPNKDIEDIMKDVVDDVHSQTNGYQLPERTSSVAGRVYLVYNDVQVETPKQFQCDRKFELHHTSEQNKTQSQLVHQNKNASKYPSPLRDYSPDFCSSDDDDHELPLNFQLPPLNNQNDASFFPSIKPLVRPFSNKQIPSGRSVPIRPIEDFPTLKIIGKLPDQRRISVNNQNRTPGIDLSFPLDSRQLSENNPSRNYNLTKTLLVESRNDQKYVNDSVTSSSSESEKDNDSGNDIPESPKEYIPKDERDPKLIPSHKQSVQSKFQNNLKLTSKEEPAISSQPVAIIPRHENNKSLTISDNTEVLTVRICTLLRRHCIKIAIQTAMKDFIDVIWSKIQFDMERYRKESHILLLFNHRLHIFVDNDPTMLVQKFLSLSPPSHSSTSESTDFYIYGLPLECASSRYNYANEHISLFGNPNSWCPSYFVDYKQTERPQSILLSSLYAFRLYFRPENRDLMGQQVAMEAQFFLQLRKYLFPPAILAMKHVINGSMFWFEKPLLTDALIQLLTHLCNPEMVFSEEICDFIPLLFCWLLEKCDPTAEKEDCFREVRLINDQKDKSSYFQNPVTTSKNNRQAFLLEEFDARCHYDALQYHYDIRSLTLYLSRLTKTSVNVASKCDNYVIYDPTIQHLPCLESLHYWTETNIKELHRTMARKREYRSFIIITRGDVTADVKNQLVLLQKDRTVALIFSPKNIKPPDRKTPRDINHFFQIFDPLQCTKETPYLVVTSDTFLDEKSQLPDPRLPKHFNDCLNITDANTDSSPDNNTTDPASQVSVILLDRSRSMSDYRITSSDKKENCTHIDICKMMLGRLSDNLLSTDEFHAFGLIEFAKGYKTVCPITRSREQFEKALSFDNCRGDWTCMYDAICEAIRQIKAFTSSPKRAREGCKKLIICLSDGINNSGDTTIQNLNDLTKKNSIVIDFISFIRDDQLKSKEEVTKARKFRELCANSGGYVYRNLYGLSDIELASIFEQEAAVWLSKRSKTSHGLIDKPERDVPLAFKETAIRQPPFNKNIQSSSRLRRILNEFEEMLGYSSEDITVFAVPSNIAFWKVILKGPDDTPYQGKFWMLYVEFVSHYPNCPPNVRFVTPMYHVNISGDGKVCHQILSRCWSSQTKMSAIFKNILDLLKKPNFDDAMSLEKAHLYKENSNDYNKQAEIYSNKYAKNDIKTLKCEYRLEDDDNQIDE